MRRWNAAAVLIALALAGCSQPAHKTSNGEVQSGPKGPQTFTVALDSPSPDGQNLEVAAPFPLRIKVRPGDTIVFENRSTQAPHTVTFGVSMPDLDGLPPVTKAGVENPVVFRPCYADAVPPAGAEACPSAPPASPPQFTGTGFWNSGALAPGGRAPGAASKVALTIAPGTAPNVYIYHCLLHRYMAGTLEIVENDEDRDRPADEAAELEQQRSNVVAGAATLTEPASPPGVGATVTAGWGNNVVALNRFAPAVTTVKAGEMVTWKTANPFEPHTVTFESPFKAPADPGALTPGGAKSGARYSGGFAQSGLIGPKPFPSDSFSLVFTKPGTYSYACALHPGMTGQVVVTP